MRNCIQHMLDVGFGLYSINEALSVKYCHDSMELCITPLAGFNEDPVYIEIISREPGRIRDEIMCRVSDFMASYAAALMDDILRL